MNYNEKRKFSQPPSTTSGMRRKKSPPLNTPISNPSSAPLFPGTNGNVISGGSGASSSSNANSVSTTGAIAATTSTSSSSTSNGNYGPSLVTNGNQLFYSLFVLTIIYAYVIHSFTNLKSTRLGGEAVEDASTMARTSAVQTLMMKSVSKGSAVPLEKPVIVPRIYCMVFSQSYMRKRMGAVLDTWGGQCDVLKFLVPRESSSPLRSGTSSSSSSLSSSVNSNTVGRGRRQNPGKTTAATTATTTATTTTTTAIPRYVFGLEKKHLWAEVIRITTVRENATFNTWERTWRSLVYFARTQLDKADFFCRIDQEAYFIPANLRKFLGWVVVA